MTAPTVDADRVSTNVARYAAEHTNCELYFGEEPPREDTSANVARAPHRRERQHRALRGPPRGLRALRPRRRAARALSPRHTTS
jgi:hypothetical protein